jgi:hypothetical protein
VFVGTVVSIRKGQDHIRLFSLLLTCNVLKCPAVVFGVAIKYAFWLLQPFVEMKNNDILLLNMYVNPGK